MQTVSVIGFDGALASAVTGIIDLFRLAGVTWARIHGDEPHHYFSTRLLTENAKPCKCINGLTLLSDGAWNDPSSVVGNDLVIIPTIGAPIETVLADNPALVAWLGQLRDRDSGTFSIASNCTGAFFLAEAGLLEGREATTHWGFSRKFCERYPGVRLDPEKLVTVDGPVACAGGGMAWWDLGVYLVERFAGAQVARELAKAFVIDAGRTSQAPYGALQARRYHSDGAILKLQVWLDGHFHQMITMQEMANRAGLTERSLMRRFKAATGETPVSYLQVLRIENARELLEFSRDTVESVVRRVGYEDVSSFSRLFRKHTGLTPGAYRARFGR